jgi:hypothetical protein
MWEPRPLTPLRAFTTCYRDSFTFFYLVYLVPKDKLRVKLLFTNEQIQNEGSFTLCFNIYLKSREGFELPRNHTHVCTSSVRVKCSYKYMCFLINPSSQVGYIFLLLIIWSFWLHGEIHFSSTPGNWESVVLICSSFLSRWTSISPFKQTTLSCSFLFHLEAHLSC